MDIYIPPMIIINPTYVVTKTIVLHMDGRFFSFRVISELALPSTISWYKYIYIYIYIYTYIYIHSYFVIKLTSLLLLLLLLPPWALAGWLLFKHLHLLTWENLKNCNSTSLVSQLATYTWRSEKQTTKSILQLAFFFSLFCSTILYQDNTFLYFRCQIIATKPTLWSNLGDSHLPLALCFFAFLLRV